MVIARVAGEGGVRTSSRLVQETELGSREWCDRLNGRILVQHALGYARSVRIRDVSFGVAQMSLTGSLTTMPIAELLGWIGGTSRIGILTIRGVGSETMLHLRHARIVECAALDPPVRLGQFLLFHGIIDEETLDRAMRAHAETGQRLGEVLLGVGAVSSEDLGDALTAKAEETVLGSFDHTTGWFTFDPSLTSLEAPQPLDMSITDAIGRGGMRAKTAAVAASVLKRSGTVLSKTAKVPSAKLNSVWPLRNAYALVDGERTIEEIALHMHGTEYHVIQRLHQLFLEGFIDVIDRIEATPSSELELLGDGIHTPEVAESSGSVTPDRVEPCGPHQPGSRLDFGQQ